MKLRKIYYIFAKFIEVVPKNINNKCKKGGQIL